MMKRNDRTTAIAAVLAAVLAAGSLAHPKPAHAQVAPAAYGLITGTAAGAYVTMGIFVAETRAGKYLYSLHDALRPRWELVPAIAMPVGGVALGFADAERLGSSIAWGGAGFAAGSVVGLALGHLLGDTAEARWSGFVIGGAAGVLVGSIYGAASCALCADHRDGSFDPGILSFRFPL